MKTFGNYLIILILINLFSCLYSKNDAQEVEEKFKDVMNKVQEMEHLESLIQLKICDESTLNGDTGLTEAQAKGIIECGKIDDDPIWNETEGNVMCIEKGYKGMSSNNILFNIFCNQTKNSLNYDPYSKCINDYYSEHFTNSEYHKQLKKTKDRKLKLELKIKHLEILLQTKQKVVECYNKTLGYSVKLDYEEKHHKYEFQNEIYLNSYALNDEKSRNESFDIQTEKQKTNEFIKCYELLNINCYKIFNDIYLQYFKQYKNQNEGTDYQKFIITKMGGIFELISRCQTQDFGSMKANDYSSKQKEIFAKLNECQLKALQMTQFEIQTLKQRQYFYTFDF